MLPVPTGGLFVNVIIVLIGGVFDLLKKIGLSKNPLRIFFLLATSEKYDSLLRRTVGYALVMFIFAMIITSTGGMLINHYRTTESNLSIIRTTIDTSQQENSTFMVYTSRIRDQFNSLIDNSHLRNLIQKERPTLHGTTEIALIDIYPAFYSSQFQTPLS